MTDFIKELLSRLCSIPTVSGFENMKDDVVKLLSPMFDEHKRTLTGSNVFIKRCGREGAPLILIDTHFDEIGLMVTEICDRGFLKFTTVGGVDSRILCASDVTVYGKEIIRGVISARPPHLMSSDEMNKNPDVDKLYIDTGYSKEWLEENIPLGSPIGFTYKNTELLNNRIAARGLDNKACVAAGVLAVKLLAEEKSDVDVALMLSVREELGGMGAMTGAYELMPDAALTLDVNFGFIPENPGADTAMYRCTAEVGEGTVISLSAVTDRKLTRELIRIAEAEGIAYQTIVEARSTGTNADKIALTGEGIPTAVLGVPLHNMHTYSEVVSVDDIISCARLVSAYIKNYGGAKYE